MERETEFAEFERMGIWHVRFLSPQWGANTPKGKLALEWLAQKDHKERRLREEAQEEQNTTARTAKNAAIVAAIAAIIAVILAIISNVIAVLAWVYPVH